MQKHELLAVAVSLAEKHGYDKITREQISTEAKVSPGTVSNVLGTMAQMRKDVVRHAVRTNNLIIQAQAIINKEPYALRKMSKGAKAHALNSIIA